MPAEPRLHPVPKDSPAAPVPKDMSRQPAPSHVPKDSRQPAPSPVPKDMSRQPAPSHVPKDMSRQPAPSPVPKDSPAAPAPAPLSPRRFAALLAAIALPLLLVLAWSLQGDPEAPANARRLAAASAPEASSDPAPTTIIRPQAPAVAVSVTVDPPRRLARLAQLSLGALDSDGRLVPTRLAPALGRRISVVNVWATYCAPCMRELPRLLDLLAARPWGADLRLVPVLLEAPDRHNEPQQAALRTLRAAPASKQQLVDLTPAGALQTLLHEAGLLPERATLPLTLVLDCEQRVRWLHRGELTDTAALGAVLDDLRAELPRCSEPSPEPVLADGCGDAYCDPDRAEDCATCPPDCACPENRECVALAGRRARCNFRSQGLKD
ncbi:MAG: TlpA family protein disulfide reductase [Nannocystis sp.]|uniref:TlpA disulfide reductase family protein n=1 Tax=Nannocystis sp. TaxID=1962667 RepID=UPI0024225329|nr:TlpA disulfide reductase family protein [Nannocystis sp.]MBK9754489.1 TlpA family protein disulfide reductase [Nannocystis sp.]